MPRRRKRLDSASFDLPAEQLRRGDFSHPTAVWARDVLIADGRSPLVTVQFSCEQSGLLGGIDEAIAVLRMVVSISLRTSPRCAWVYCRGARASRRTRARSSRPLDRSP